MPDTVSINGVPLMIGPLSIADNAVTLPKLGADVIQSLPSPTDAQVDSAVSDWLTAHPEATTTVQDGAITDAKLADIYGLENREPFGYSVYSYMLESGRIDDSGAPVAHSSRCRTKNYLPVNAGDLIIIKYDPDNDRSVMLSYYDSSKTFISNTSWYSFNISFNAIIKVAQSGYIKATFNAADISLFNGYVMVCAHKSTKQELVALSNALNITVDPIPSSAMLYGPWNEDGSRGSSKIRASNIRPIPVRKGDELHFTAKGDYLVAFGFSTDGSSISFDAYSNMPYKAPSDGYAYFNVKKVGNANIADFSEWDNAITIYRADSIPSVQNVSAFDMVNGYVNDSGIITASSTRLTNWNPVHARKGDVVRINSLEVMAWIYEFNDSKALLAKSTNYYTPEWVGGNYNLCGDYVVKNDCWIMLTIAPIIGFTPQSFTPADYDNAVSIIHFEATRNINTSEHTMFRLPRAARKPNVFNTTAIVSQAATFVNGKLWAAVDGDTDYIQVIDPSTGVIERTITHDLGHCNCLDYCKDTDTLLTMDTVGYNKILLYPNASQATTSIAKADCVTVELAANDIDFAGTACFGQDSREVLLYTGKGSLNPYNLYKIVLGYSSGAYTGSYSGLVTYSGIIRDNIDTYIAGSTQHYAQDSCYDGYFYMAYGTGGHNFLAIDLDESRGTYQIVGNYLHHEYDASYAELYPEPEGVCIENGKIWCLSRENNVNAYYFNVFNL